MALDQTGNFHKVTVSTTYDDSATSIELSSGEGATLPDPTEGEYNMVWWDSTNYADPADDPNVEIVRVTAISTDTLTVSRNQESSGASTKNTAGATYKMILAPTAKTVTDLASSSPTVTITQNGHGFSVGNWLYNTAGTYALAQADDTVTAEVCGVVAATIDANTFQMQLGGEVTGLSGLTNGAVYFLSDGTAGAITATEPGDESDVSKPVLIANGTGSGYMFNFRGVEIVPSKGAYNLAFTNSDLSSGDLTVTHGVGHKHVHVVVTDNNDKVVQPDDITHTSTTQCTIDLTSFGTLTGTWNVLVIGQATGMAVSTDGTLSANSDDNLVSEKAVKTYVDSFAGSCSFLVKATAMTNLATGSFSTITWGTEVHDTGGDFASNTFTAPAAGTYLFTYGIRLDDIDIDSSYYVIRIDATTNIDNLFESSTYAAADYNYTFTGSVVMTMTASETATMTISPTGGAAQTDLHADSWWSGVRLA